MKSIRFESVSKSFDSETVLDEISFKVDPGDMKIILGGSGSGKSTLLKMILGLIRPDAGEIFLDEEDITKLSEDELMPIRNQIGMVFQAGALFDSLTVGENVAYRLREQGELGESEIEETVRKVLGFVSLENTMKKMPSELSGGMRRRVAIARALVGNPQIMLYDEPTAGLDPITGRTICEMVMRLRDLEEATSIYVTHDWKAAMTISNEVAVETDDGEIVFREQEGAGDFSTDFLMLEGGRVLLEGDASVLRNTDDEYVREFLD